MEREISMPTHAEAIAAVLEILVDSENGVIASTDEILSLIHISISPVVIVLDTDHLLPWFRGLQGLAEEAVQMGAPLFQVQIGAVHPLTGVGQRKVLGSLPEDLAAPVPEAQDADVGRGLRLCLLYTSQFAARAATKGSYANFGGSSAGSAIQIRKYNPVSRVSMPLLRLLKQIA